MIWGLRLGGTMRLGLLFLFLDEVGRGLDWIMMDEYGHTDGLDAGGVRGCVDRHGGR